jgi:very-short-patch-repair endonuclease
MEAIGGSQQDEQDAKVLYRVELDSSPTIGYASIQNSVPVIRTIRLSNNSEAELADVELLVRCDPAFAVGAKLRFQNLAPGETRSLGPIDLEPDHSFLADLQEGMTATVSLTLVRGDSELAREAKAIEVLAYDQWAGTRALPELLAAFSMPNNPAVDVLIGKASKLLRSSNAELSMNGYQSKSRDVVWKQVSALYSTIAAENLQYAEPPASFGSDGQKIRTPDRILEGRVATCLDLAMLFSSCLEQAGLRPVILMKQGHAWVGVWLHQASFPFPLTDDVLAVRKRMNTGEFLVFETTAVAQHKTVRSSLRMAMEQGARHLHEEDTFLYAVDIHMARGVQIKPLPSRVTLARAGADVSDVDAPEQIEPTPQLPPLDPEFLAPIDLGTEDTPEGRLAKWKGKLLDLTLRNKLLNFKPTKASLQLVAPDLAALEDGLAAGQDFRVKPLPGLMEGTDPRSAQVHIGRTGRAPLDEMAFESLANQEVIARAQQEALDGSLLAMFSAARTGLEEGGANTLYLALGMLKWREAERAEVVHTAPLILVPVSLTRQSVKSGFRLTRHDDETIVNPTLLQLLRTAFDLSIPGLDLTPTDDKGVDVGRILQAFRLAVREIAGWEVQESAWLGIFSFTKYLMWKDLQDRTEALKANRVVSHLVDHPGQAFATEARDERSERLDENYKPQDILAPLLSDSSQLKAICAVDSGRDLVLEGPPGTGKSQTITNLIAHCLAKGKSVLFVSEKMAALEVVHSRLTKIGLGPFCLELHSSKAKKSEVLQQLGAALGAPGRMTSDEWNIEAQRLAGLRQELNGFAEALHRRHGNGLTPYNAIGLCIANRSRQPSPMPWVDGNVHSTGDLLKLREAARRISALGQALPTLANHPLALIGQAEWSPSWQDDLLAGADVVSDAAGTLKQRVEPLAKLLGIAPAGQSMEAFSALDQLAEMLMAAPKVPVGLAKQANDERTRSRIASLVAHGKVRQRRWEEIGTGWSAELAKFTSTELKAEWSQAENAWWPKSWFAKKAVLGKLASVRLDGRPASPETLSRAFEPLADVNDEDEFLRSMQSDAKSLLQESFAGVDTKWVDVEAHNAWAARYAQALEALAHTQSQGVDGAQSLNARLVPLLGEQRAMLLPAGLVGSSLVSFREALADFNAKLLRLTEVARPVEPLSGPAGADGPLERVRAVIDRWKKSKGDLRPWCQWRKVRDEAIAQGLQGLVTAVEAGAVPLANVAGHFEFSYQNWWLRKTFDVDPLLRNFASADHERKIVEFREVDARFQELTKAYIVAQLSARVPSATAVSVGADSEMGRLRRELQKQKRHMPVRQLVQGLPTLLPKLKPCLLMSPLSVAQYLDARHAQFDLVVFDEASQIPVWDAVGVIARGKQLVVVGDPKQLPPTSFFAKSSEDGDGAGSEDQVEDLESILDECLGAGMNRLSLKWHYRSKHESLITFSNVRYYGSELVTFPSPVTSDVAVRFHPVAGVYDRGGTRTNRAEAEAVVKAIEAHFTGTRSKASVGVVTFNQTQQALIETLLDARRRQNGALDRALAEVKHEELFVKNLENVQGDERDIIFFSITYGPDAAGKVTMNFGPLNGEGGHRRLNVAVSRAREGVVIFSTLRPEQIDLSKVRAAGVKDLKHYLEFAIGGPRALVASSAPTGLGPDSPFEVAVANMLRDKGWVVHSQVGCSGYRIDMAVVDPRAPGRYLLGVECDGASYHSSASARDRDRLRQHVLESLGWQLHRIWSTDWWFSAERELEKLHAKLEATLSQEAPVSMDAVSTGDEHAEVEASGREAALFAGLAPIQTAPRQQPELPRYMPVEVRGGTPEAFYEPSAAPQIRESVAHIIAQEGPVPDSVLFERVARAWGLKRTGSKIVERLQRLVPGDATRTSDSGKTFYWPPGAQPSGWSTFRVAGEVEDSKRHVSDVSLEEIGALVKHLLQQAGASRREDLARTACKLLGMARTPADAEARVETAIQLLLSSAQVSEVDGYVRL